MKRHKALIPLSQDHHNGLMLAQLIKKDAPEYKGLPTDLEGKVKYTIESWKNELKIHFNNEETILFPAVIGKNEEIDNLINELVSEHTVIKQKIISLETTEDTPKILNELGVILEKHIRKEERDLFQKIQSLCLNELEELDGKITPAKNNCKV